MRCSLLLVKQRETVRNMPTVTYLSNRLMFGFCFLTQVAFFFPAPVSVDLTFRNMTRPRAATFAVVISLALLAQQGLLVRYGESARERATLEQERERDVFCFFFFLPLSPLSSLLFTL